MSSLDDRSDSPRWPVEPQQPGINWAEIVNRAEIVLLAVVLVADVAGVAALAWWMGAI
jgi:hypothetical protein